MNVFLMPPAVSFSAKKKNQHPNFLSFKHCISIIYKRIFVKASYIKFSKSYSQGQKIIL